MEGIFDSHAHYDDDSFDDNRDYILNYIKENHVVGVIDPATTIASSKKVIAMGKTYDFLYPAVGIFPSEITTKEEMKSTLDYLKALAVEKANKVVAIGEIGLDYHYDGDTPENRKLQKDWFIAQIKLAKELDLPIIVHDRDAHGDMMDILKEYRPKGVVHCFSGSVELMKETIKLGMYISMGGVVTFKNAVHSVEVIKEVPMDRLLLETDSPYLSPVPFRGKQNNSSYIKYVAEKIGEIKGISADEVIKIAKINALNLFNITLDI